MDIAEATEGYRRRPRYLLVFYFMSVFSLATTADFVCVQARTRPVAEGQSFALYDVLLVSPRWNRIEYATR